MTVVILLLIGLAISMLTPIFLHDILGIRFYKKEKLIDLHAWFKTTFLKTKKMIKRMKIKFDYLIVFVFLILVFFLGIYLIRADGKIFQISNLLKWIIAGAFSIMVFYLVIKIFKIKKTTIKLKKPLLPKFTKSLKWSKIIRPAFLILLIGVSCLYLISYKQETDVEKAHFEATFKGNTENKGLEVKYFDLYGDNIFVAGKRQVYLQHPGKLVRFISMDRTEFSYSRIMLEDEEIRYTIKVTFPNGKLKEEIVDEKKHPKPPDSLLFGPTIIVTDKNVRLRCY